MSINLTESSRDRDGEREGNNCLERGLERTIISPRGRSSPGPRIRPPRVYRGEKGNDLSFLEEGEGEGEFSRSCYVARRHSSSLSSLSFSIIASLLPKIICTRDPVSQRGAYRYESNDNIYFRTEIRFTKIFPLYFLVVYFGKIGFVPSRNRRKLDRSLSVIVLLHRSLFLSFDSLVSSPIHRYYLQIPNFLFFLTRIVRCTALKFIISWKIYSCRFAVEYIIDKYRYTVKDVGGRKFKSKFNLKYIYISRIIIYLYNSVMYMRYIPCESLPHTCE